MKLQYSPREFKVLHLTSKLHFSAQRKGESTTKKMYRSIGIHRFETKGAPKHETDPRNYGATTHRTEKSSSRGCSSCATHRCTNRGKSLEEQDSTLAAIWNESSASISLSIFRVTMNVSTTSLRFTSLIEFTWW